MEELILLSLYYPKKSADSIYSLSKSQTHFSQKKKKKKTLILIRRVDSLEKTLMLGGDWRQEEEGMTEDEMAGWHH